MRYVACIFAICLCLCLCSISRAQQLTPEQQAAVNKLLNLPPGSTITLETTRVKDGGTIETEEEAKGKGAALRARGDKIVSDFNSTAPGADLGMGRHASGGDTESNTSLSTASLFSNPLVWVGIICIFGAGVSFFLKLPWRVTGIVGAIGVGFIATAMFPAFVLFIVAGAALLVVIPYIHQAYSLKNVATNYNKSYEALRAVVAGVGDFGNAAKDPSNPTVDPSVYERLKSYIKAHASDEDDAAIRAIKEKDRI